MSIELRATHHEQKEESLPIPRFKGIPVVNERGVFCLPVEALNWFPDTQVEIVSSQGRPMRKNAALSTLTYAYRHAFTPENHWMINLSTLSQILEKMGVPDPFPWIQSGVPVIFRSFDCQGHAISLTEKMKTHFSSFMETIPECLYRKYEGETYDFGIYLPLRKEGSALFDHHHQKATLYDRVWCPITVYNEYGRVCTATLPSNFITMD